MTHTQHAAGVIESDQCALAPHPHQCCEEPVPPVEAHLEVDEFAVLWKLSVVHGHHISRQNPERLRLEEAAKDPVPPRCWWRPTALTLLISSQRNAEAVGGRHDLEVLRLSRLPQVAAALSASMTRAAHAATDTGTALRCSASRRANSSIRRRTRHIRRLGDYQPRAALFEKIARCAAGRVSFLVRRRGDRFLSTVAGAKRARVAVFASVVRVGGHGAHDLAGGAAVEDGNGWVRVGQM